MIFKILKKDIHSLTAKFIICLKKMTFKFGQETIFCVFPCCLALAFKMLDTKKFSYLSGKKCGVLEIIFTTRNYITVDSNN